MQANLSESNRKSDPLITIITVVYNAEDSIERTIQNIIGQTYKNIEYIIIDGASTDRTFDIIKRYEDQISYWISEPDDGIYFAMNKAIDIAEGTWINFMNAGDTFVNKTVISDFVNKIDYSDICYGTRYLHRGEKKSLEKTGILENIYYNMPFGHQAAFVKKELLKKYKFNLSYKLSADYDFFIQCYRDQYIFQDLDFPICNFYEGGLSYDLNFKSLLETLKVLSDYVDEETIKKSAFYTQTLKRIMLNEEDIQSNKIDELCNKELEITKKELSKIHSVLNNLITISIFTHPIQKYHAYKQMIKVYFQFKKMIKN